MKQLYLFFFAALLSADLSAHPSYGIVITENNEIIFCDVLHNEGTIWKLDQTGELREILTGLHSHFLFLDRQGHIWGTDHDYIAARETNRNTLWRLVDGQQETIIPPTEDPSVFSGVNFVAAPDGTIYFDTGGQLYVRSTEGATRLLSDHKFGRIMSLQLTPDGQLLVVDNYADNGSLIQVSPRGELTIIATCLLEDSPADPPFEEARFNMLYAAFAGTDGEVFVANSGSRRISRVAADGAITHIYHSEKPWYPVAYTEKDGIGYVMEMCYLPGIGNLGPQIIRLENGAATVLVNVDADKMPEIAPLDPDKNEGERAVPSNWFWYGLGVVMLFILLGWWFSRRRNNAMMAD
ncbi:NHL repeat-containing protein [Flavilitoribacter nigricans]|uniref:SMP-30/Gluconolactonase/LRE-like region domain-containing protein n=1 Tax=Flavilitoribacter nigricans (strain ATCC 23147 / DSM 23189 / NBRC 102662 / NCIMB 1420 / SS-2) TaxID=1122177 RepID=A0A2D0N4V0_FLAN2|nr:hypothetical protein [Flavilitoribacter nigricans]PHN03418.1 hypothetical protein CRP01_27430 [Flavilitoribacter nigricans DSM 23189 = NBRC 102662]